MKIHSTIALYLLVSTASYAMIEKDKTPSSATPDTTNLQTSYKILDMEDDDFPVLGDNIKISIPSKNPLISQNYWTDQLDYLARWVIALCPFSIRIPDNTQG